MRQAELDAQQALREAELAAQHEQIKLESEKNKTCSRSSAHAI